VVQKTGRTAEGWTSEWLPHASKMTLANDTASGPITIHQCRQTGTATIQLFHADERYFRRPGSGPALVWLTAQFTWADSGSGPVVSGLVPLPVSPIHAIPDLFIRRNFQSRHSYHPEGRDVWP
jgi:hypothetical protein